MCSSLQEGLHARAIWSLSVNQSALKVLKLLHKWEVEIKCSLTATMKNVHRWVVFYVWNKFSLLRFSWEQRHILLCTFWKKFEMGLSTAFPFEFGFFRLPGKNPKGGHPHSCICNPNLLLTDTLYYRIQVGLKREVFHMCECVLLAISPKKSVVRVVGNFT